MKLVLFQATTGKVLPGVLTERGVVEIADAVPVGHTPQATMEGIIDGFEGQRPALERLANERDPLPLSAVRLRAPLPRPGKILACIANYWIHGRRLDQSRGGPTQPATERRLIGLAR